MKFNNTRKIISIILSLIFIGILLGFINFYFAISGKLDINYNFSKKPEMISQLEPPGRVNGREHNLKTGEYYQRINGDPVYFSAEVPRSFDKATVILEYLNPEQNLIELGLEKYGEGNFELKPLENKMIDNLDWNNIQDEETGLTLYQKEKNYENIDDFLDNLPEDKKIGTYHYNLKPDIDFPDYTSDSVIKDIPLNLLGSHDFIFYISADENPYLQFSFRHIDEQGDTSPINLSVKKEGVEIINESFQKNTKEIDLSNLGKGLISLSITANNNTLIQSLKTNLQKMIIKNHIYPVDSENLELITNSQDLNFRPWTTAGLQTININNQELNLNKVTKLFNFREIGEKEILLPHGNVEIIGDGYFAFNDDMFFNPDANIEKIKYYSDIQDFDYLLVNNYTQPSISKKNIITAEQEFDLIGVPGDRKNLNFVISLPGKDEVTQDVIMHNINIKLERPSLWERIFKK